MIDLTPVANSIIALIAALISAFLIPYIKTRISAEKYAEVQEWVTVAVRAAEMIYTGTGRGAEKKRYVLEFLEGKGYTLDSTSVDNMIESAVLNLQK